MSVPHDILEGILHWDSLSDTDNIKSAMHTAILEILHVPGGYTTDDILSKICKPDDVAATDYPMLHQLNRKHKVLLSVLCKSPFRLTRLLDYMVKRDIIQAVDMGPKDNPDRHYYVPAKKEPLDVPG